MLFLQCMVTMTGATFRSPLRANGGFQERVPRLRVSVLTKSPLGAVLGILYTIPNLRLSVLIAQVDEDKEDRELLLHIPFIVLPIIPQLCIADAGIVYAAVWHLMCYFPTAAKQVGIIDEWMRDEVRSLNGWNEFCDFRRDRNPWKWALPPTMFVVNLAPAISGTRWCMS